MKIITIFTCFNRKEKTENCIKTLSAGNPQTDFTFVAVDDGSRDGTPDMLRGMDGYDIRVLEGDGNLYYSGGMRLGMEYALREIKDADYLLMVNDDVDFYPEAIEKMVAQSKEQRGAVIVGAMCDQAGNLSYSAVLYETGLHYRRVCLSEWEREADTFNANAVLVPYEAFLKVGAMDEHYIHSLGDFDFGLSLKKKGYSIHVSKEYVGVCNNNPTTNSWTNPSLKRMDRLRKKENPKGAPFGPWFYFVKKHFGLLLALKSSITPYIRILIGK